MSKRNGIVLLELSIAIPVVLFAGAAMIASLLGRRETPSTQVYCLTSLNALCKSAFIYAEMSQGFLMPYTHAPVPGTELTEAAPSADHTAVCFADGPINPATGRLADCRNYGIVYDCGLLGPAEMFYCPQQRQKPYVLKDYPTPWGSAVPQGSQFIFNGYMFNPWVKAATGGRQFVYEYGLSIQKHPNELFLVADLILGPATIAHRSKGAPVWNLAFPDGHAEGRTIQGLARLFQAHAETDWNSWTHWGAASADGQEPPPDTVRYQVLVLGY